MWPLKISGWLCPEGLLVWDPGKTGCIFSFIESWDNRMVWMGKQLKDDLIPAPCHGLGQVSIISGCSEPQPTWSWTSREVASTTLLGNHSQCLTTLIVKDFFSINLNFPSFSLNPLLLALSLQFLMKGPSPSSSQVPFKPWKVATRSPHNLLLTGLSWASPQLSQPNRQVCFSLIEKVQ